MTNIERNKKSKELLENKKKIIELWGSGNTVLALILGRTVMSDEALFYFTFHENDGCTYLEINGISFCNEDYGIEFINKYVKYIENPSYEERIKYFTKFLDLTCGKRKKKIIELWKSDEKVLALILARSLMTDREVLKFCIESEDINDIIPDSFRILDININGCYFVYYNDNDCVVETSYEKWYDIKDEDHLVRVFRKYLNYHCGNKRIKK